MIVKYEDLPQNEKDDFDRIVKEQEEKEAAWFKDWGFFPAQVMAARVAYQGFLEKENRSGHNFYKAPLARKAFMIGWLLNDKTAGV